MRHGVRYKIRQGIGQKVRKGWLKLKTERMISNAVSKKSETGYKSKK